MVRSLVFKHLLQSPALMTLAGSMVYLYQASGMQRLVRGSGLLKLFGKLGDLEQLAPPAEVPFFFNKIGKTFPAEGEKQHRVAMMAGCLANVSFARLERGDRSGAAEERHRSGDPERPGLLRRAARPRRNPRRSPQTRPAQYRRGAESAASTR